MLNQGRLRYRRGSAGYYAARDRAIDRDEAEARRLTRMREDREKAAAEKPTEEDCSENEQFQDNPGGSV